MNGKLPRAPGDQACAIMGKTWNQAADQIERGGKLRFGPEFIVSDGPDGAMVSLGPQGDKVLVRITSKSVSGTDLGAGWYSGRTQILMPSTSIDPTVDMNFQNLFQDVNSSADDCYVGNVFESDFAPGVHVLPLDGKQFVWATPFGMTSASSSVTPRLLLLCVSPTLWYAAPVTLSNPSGSYGSNGPPPAYANLTYTVTGMDGSHIADNVPVDIRPVPGHIAVAATFGLYYPNASLSARIAICNELIDTGAC